MQGLATRNALHRLIKPEPLGLRARLARLWVWLKPAPKAPYDLIIQDDYIPSTFGPMNLGTPAEARRTTTARRHATLRELAIAIALVATGLLLGRSADPDTLWARAGHIQAEAARNVQPAADPIRDRAALLMPAAKRKCQVDWKEGCLACRYDNGLGEIIDTMMC